MTSTLVYVVVPPSSNADMLLVQYDTPAVFYTCPSTETSAVKTLARSWQRTHLPKQHDTIQHSTNHTDATGCVETQHSLLDTHAHLRLAADNHDHKLVRHLMLASTAAHIPVNIPPTADNTNPHRQAKPPTTVQTPLSNMHTVAWHTCRTTLHQPGKPLTEATANIRLSD